MIYRLCKNLLLIIGVTIAFFVICIELFGRGGGAIFIGSLVDLPTLFTILIARYARTNLRVVIWILINVVAWEVIFIDRLAYGGRFFVPHLIVHSIIAWSVRLRFKKHRNTASNDFDKTTSSEKERDAIIGEAMLRVHENGGSYEDMKIIGEAVGKAYDKQMKKEGNPKEISKHRSEPKLSSSQDNQGTDSKVTPNDIIQTTANNILNADGQRTSPNDMMVMMNIMAHLAAFVGVLRDECGISFKEGSFAEKYADEIQSKNYGYICDAQDFIVSSLKKDLSAQNFSSVLLDFISHPEPAFERKQKEN